MKKLLIILLLTSATAQATINLDDATFNKRNEQAFVIAVMFQNDKQISTIYDAQNETSWDIWYK